MVRPDQEGKRAIRFMYVRPVRNDWTPFFALSSFRRGGGDVAVVRRIGQAREAAATKTSLGHNHLFLILTDSEGV